MPLESVSDRMVSAVQAVNEPKSARRNLLHLHQKAGLADNKEERGCANQLGYELR